VDDATDRSKSGSSEQGNSPQKYAHKFGNGDVLIEIDKYDLEARGCNLLGDGRVTKLIGDPS
jgi:hypothetical protein